MTQSTTLRPLHPRERAAACPRCLMPAGTRCRRTRWPRVGVPYLTLVPHAERGR